MPMFIARFSREFSHQIEAVDEQEAIEKAAEMSDGEWESSDDSPIEAEEE
jgi:hypothetical protein